MRILKEWKLYAISAALLTMLSGLVIYWVMEILQSDEVIHATSHVIEIKEAHLKDDRTFKTYMNTVEKAYQSSGKKLEMFHVNASGALTLSETKVRMMQSKFPDVILLVDYGNGHVELPLSLIKLDEAADRVKMDEEEMYIHIKLDIRSKAYERSFVEQIQKYGFQLISDLYTYSLVYDGEKGEWVDDDFGLHYVKHVMKIDRLLDISQSSVILVNDELGRGEFAPHRFYLSEDETVAVIEYPGNSTFAVIERNASFSDIDDHWAGKSIEHLANKWIFYGMPNQSFEPSEYVTKAEMAVLAIRVLGLSNKPVTQQGRIGELWYAKSAALAKEYGLMDVDDDENDWEQEVLTREQLMVMLSRMLEIVGNPNDDDSASNHALLSFSDEGEVSSWARESVSMILKTGIVKGDSDGKLSPEKAVSRADAAEILVRFMQYTNLINTI